MWWSEKIHFLSAPAAAGCLVLALLVFSGGCGNPPAGQVETVDFRYLKIVRTGAVTDTVDADSILLHLVDTGGDTVRGTYQWQLPGKDGKWGAITGVRSGDTVNGHYQYTQEGGSYRDSVQVFLGTGQAIVKQYAGDGYTLLDTLTAWIP